MIEFKNVSFSYNAKSPVLKNINAVFEAGKSYSVIGRSGCGKSTLLRLMNGLLKPQSGNIYVDGANITSKSADLKPVRKNVGLVFQYPEHQLFAETVEEDIAFGPSNIGMSDVNTKVKTAIEAVGLTSDILTKSPFEISGGEQRKVAIAGVIAMEPNTIVLDEPSAGLDPVSSSELFKMLQNYKSNGKTVIFASHNMKEAAMYSDEIYIINNGEIFMHGTPKEIFERANDLKNIGLALPQIAELMLSLKENGFGMRISYDLENALEEIGIFL